MRNKVKVTKPKKAMSTKNTKGFFETSVGRTKKKSRHSKDKPKVPIQVKEIGIEDLKTSSPFPEPVHSS